MKAKKKPLDKTSPEELGVSIESNLKVIDISEPAKRSGGTKVESVDELVSKLKEAGVV
jgi:electron transfer flavoprotein beta subunit